MKRAWAVLRRALALGGGLAAVGLVMAMALVTLLHADAVSTRVINGLAGRWNPYPSTRLSVERAELSWPLRLRLRGVALTPDAPGGARGPRATAERVEARLSLGPLLRGRLEVAEASLIGADLSLTQRPDSTWDFLAPFTDVRSRSQRPDRTGFRSGPVRVEGARIEATFARADAATPADSLVIEDLTLQLGSLDLSAESASASMDTLDVHFRPPGSLPDRVRVQGRGALSEGRLTVDGLTLQSEASDVRVRGVLLLPGRSRGEAEEMDFRVSAEPLALRDIAGFVRSVDPAAGVRAEFHVVGRTSRAEVSGQATLSDGGAVEVEGVFAPFLRGAAPMGATGSPAAPPVEQRVEARVSGLRLATFLGTGPVGGTLDGHAELDLSGPEAALLTGPVAAHVEGLTIRGQRTLPLDVSGELAAGEADVQVSGGLSGWGRFGFTLEGRPLDSQPAVALRGAFRQEERRDSTAGGPGPLGLEGLEARFLVGASAGRDGPLTPASLRRLEVQVLSGSYRGESLAGGSLRASWQGDEGRVGLDQPFGEGRLTGRLAVRDTWTSLEALEITGAIRASGIRLGTVTVDSATLRPGFEAGRLTARIEAALSDQEGRPAGSVSADLRGRPLDDEPFLELEELVFSALDLEAVASIPTRLEGSGRARLDGFDPTTSRLRAELALDSSSAAGLRLHSGNAMLSLAEGRLGADGEVDFAGGSLAFGGYARPLGEALELEIEGLEMRGLDLAALLPDAAPSSDLNLDVALSATGPGWRTMSAHGDIVVRPSTVRDGVIRGGALRLDADAGNAVAGGEIRIGAGAVDLTARISLVEGGDPLRVEAVLDLPDLAPFLGVEQEVAVAGEAAVEWSRPAGVAFASDLRGRGLGAVIDTLFLAGSMTDSVLLLDTLRLRSDLVHADASGALALGAEAGATGGLEPPTRELAAKFEISAPLLLGTLPVLGETTVRSGSGSAGLGGRPGARTAALSLDLGPWETRRTTGRGGRIRASYTPANVSFEASLPSAATRDTLEIALRAEHRPEEQRGLLEQLEVSTAAGDWALVAPATYSWGDQLRVDGLELSAGEGRLSVDGRVSRLAEHDLTVRLERAPLAALGPLFGLEELSVEAGGVIVLTGTAADPRAEGALRMEIGPRDEPAAVVEGSFSLAGGRTTVDARFRDSTGGELTLAGTASAAGVERTDSAGGVGPTSTVRDIDVTVEARDFDVSWARALVPGRAVLDLQGTLTTELRISGSLERPEIAGDVGVNDGLVQLASTATRYQDVQLVAGFLGGDLRLESLHARSGSGTADVRGTIGLGGGAPSTLDLSVGLDRFLAWNAPPVSAVVSGDVAIRGTVEEPFIEGRLNPEGSRLNLDDYETGASARAVQLTEEDFQMLEDYFGYSVSGEDDASPEERLARFGLRLSVSFDQDVWVTRFPQPRVSLECNGDLEIDKDPGGTLQIVGTISVLPERSYFRQFGRRFAVDQGTLTFDGDPAGYSVAASASWELPSYSDPDQPEVVVNLGVSGEAERLDLTLSSEPQMEESEIVSYLATGQSQGILASDAQGASTNLGVAMATGAVAGVLESFAADRVALDVVEIAVDPVRGTTLVAGRYVSPDLYLGFRQSVSFGEDGDRTRTQNQLTEVELEYRWFRWLTVNLQTSASELRFFLRSRHDY